MPCLVRTTLGELRVTADYSSLINQLRDEATGPWIELQEQNSVQTRHMMRRSAILHVTELLEGPSKVMPARILETR